MIQHALRAMVEGEIHARPIVPIPRGGCAQRLVLLEADGEKVTEAVATLGDRIDARAFMARRRAMVTGSSWLIVVERHNEFITVTLIGAREADQEQLVQSIGGLTSLPVVAACVVRTYVPPGVAPELIAALDPLSACYSRLENDCGELAGDYRVGADGFVRYELATSIMTETALGSVVRRVLEIDTYCALVLAGLPLARELLPQLQSNDQHLADLMLEVSPVSETGSELGSLQRLGQLQVRLASLVEQSRFRFGASNAYGDILKTRLLHLHESAIVNYRTHSRYLLHRVDPAIATMTATERRLRTASEQVRTAAAVLDTGLAQQIQRQNLGILSSILRTSSLQYRLQRTVEGLSVVAITYYAVALLDRVLEPSTLIGAEDRNCWSGSGVIMLMVWLGLRMLHGVSGKAPDVGH